MPFCKMVLVFVRDLIVSRFLWRMVKKLEQIEIPYPIAPSSVIKCIWPNRVRMTLHDVTSERDLALNDPGEVLRSTDLNTFEFLDHTPFSLAVVRRTGA
jgi:hypothetical protein